MKTYNQLKEEQVDSLEDKEDRIIHLRWLLKESRNHPGLSLREIAGICKEVFDGAEIEALIGELKKN